jgi:hypothetical protein
MGCVLGVQHLAAVGLDQQQRLGVGTAGAGERGGAERNGNEEANELETAAIDHERTSGSAVTRLAGSIGGDTALFKRNRGRKAKPRRPPPHSW